MRKNCPKTERGEKKRQKPQGAIEFTDSAGVCVFLCDKTHFLSNSTCELVSAHGLAHDPGAASQVFLSYSHTKALPAGTVGSGDPGEAAGV